MNSSGANDWRERLLFGFEIVIQIAIALLIVLLGVWMWPSEMMHMHIKAIPTSDWVMTAGAGVIAGFGGVVLYFALADIAKALRWGPERRQWIQLAGR